MTKIHVHNEIEAKVLIKEWNERGTPFYNCDIVFYTHGGKVLGTSQWLDYSAKHDDLETAGAYVLPL